MRIGNLELQNNIFLAPMAGVTDKTFRIICREMGAGLVFTEMVSSKGLYYGDKNTEELTDIDLKERPVAIQIFGSDPKIMAEVVEEHINPRQDIDILDINMGCPAPKIVKNGDGSALLKNPPLVREILRKVVEVSTKPVTLKIRIGWDVHTINGIEVARIAEEEGVSALTVHGRTRDMFYSGKADWDYIKKVKDSISIPVIGNGDIFEPIDAMKMMEYTGCDGVAIGRGALGNPWIFKRVGLLIEGKKDIVPDAMEKINIAIKHLNMVCDMKGEKVGVREMRKHVAWYIKGMRNSNTVKNEINTIDTKDEMIRVLSNYAQYMFEFKTN
ncbi:tRNA dihydrouridine synthase DusB [Clostridium sp. Cult3]|uniref:tRNA dihydrouridine synthase DusB n=1 Tax=Clostridium sp. Cult3 TaxID=2079004 RepID=UPI001F00249E|nr:tRNA dihydrouridine synthase DusB [Clostridium sp. Cult3]MCF6461103.1 tRNA dihydrouridine synthase DusB [Clostridium sp. Cult3]